ncbi:hypothetical protein PG993_005837 [Apiospora rasikravindrae]|uniref:DUF7707 domain-containing protein n=1 Tax=Apiospora rasikravindrae TaxID=990691 RepID=A0ABR1T9X7_9PEZI
MRELLLLCLVVLDGVHHVRSAQTAFDPNSLAVETRLSWCRDQMNSCAELCTGPGLGANSCDHMTLNYACTCDNGTAPGLPYYTRTMPTFICEQNKKDCVDDAKGDAAAEKECGDASTSSCGTLDPMLANKETDGSKGTSATATTGAETTSTATATSKPHPPDPSSPPSGGGGGGGKPSLGWMAAVIAGVLAFVGALAGGFYWLGKRRSRNKKRKSMMMETGSRDEDDQARPYKTLHDGSQLSVHEIHTSKEIPVEMDSLPQSPATVASELPSPNANHFVAELDGRMHPAKPIAGAAQTP